LKPVIFVIQSVNTFFDLAGMISARLPDASVLPTAVSGSTVISALSITARGHIPESVPAAVRRRHGGISAPFRRIDSIGNIIRQPHLL
jgi:hypothetical protein